MQQAVLVVEDDEVYREFYSRHLSGEYTLLFADTLQRAMETFDTHRPECILLDMRLPDGNGIQALPALLEKSTAVILCTAYGNEDLAVQAMKAGANDYLAKSTLDRQKLRRSVRHAFNQVEVRGAAQSLQEDLKASPSSKKLSGIVPVCSSCKKVRDEEGMWRQVEEFLRLYVGLEITHGVCPVCLESELEQIRREHARGALERSSAEQPNNTSASS